ncbi:MAG: TetR/AcrR family transcriptional regulator [Rubrivivax sp.]|jgi:AcrR family transcriptional regulator|nr:TetR/AcrR family transcriptional regulator [Rubrivivax sp.]
MPRLAFHEQVLRHREDAILAAVNRLLADKGFDLMTVDEVAAEVGIAKASLYKHFPSKEALAAAAMVRLLHRALAVIEQQNARTDGTALLRIEALVRWVLGLQLAGEMPSLPSQNSSLREELTGSAAYMDALMLMSERLGEWILAAQAAGDIDPELPSELVLFTIFARACDPVPAFLKAAGRLPDATIVELVLGTCMNGLRKR